MVGCGQLNCISDLVKLAQLTGQKEATLPKGWVESDEETCPHKASSAVHKFIMLTLINNSPLSIQEGPSLT